MSNDSIHDRLKGINNDDPEKWLSSPILNEAQQDFRALDIRRRDIKALQKQTGDTNVDPNKIRQDALDDVMAPMPRGKAAAERKAKALGFRVTPSQILEPQVEVSDPQHDDDPVATRTPFRLNFDREAAERKRDQKIAAREEEVRQQAAARAEGRGRRNAGRQWSELATAAFVADPNARTPQDILNSRIPRDQIADLEQFHQHLRGASEREVRKFLQKLSEQYEGQNMAHARPEDVYIRANANNIGPPELLEELDRLTRGSNDPKADVIFKDANDQFNGVSVKQNRNATLTNYSIEDIMNSISRDIGDENVPMGDMLQDARTQMYTDSESPFVFPTRSEALIAHPEARDGSRFSMSSGPPEVKAAYNALFANPNNEYHRLFRTMHRQFGPQIAEKILQKLFRPDLPFQLSQFDGSEFINFSQDALFGQGDLDLKLANNPAANEQGPAKQFLSWHAGNQPKYRGELRHKGDPWSSQQFFMHKDERFNPFQGQ